MTVRIEHKFGKLPTVQKLATAHTISNGAPLTREKFSLVLVLAICFLAALWFGLCRELCGEWSVNEQYSFGWFVPFFALYLFWLRWQDRPEPALDFRCRISDLSALGTGIVALLLLLPIRLFEIANPEWRLLAWIHTGVVVTLTLLVIWRAGGRKWLRHFGFPVAFIFVAVPWPTASETSVIQGLMRLVARVAAETAMLLGTPAQVEGNLIRVSSGLVGVNEACSGIRSLQTSLMIGLLFGELKRLSGLRRMMLVACSVGIALLANLVRAVFLVRIAATENLSAVDRWHDIAGYSIIFLVFVATLALAHKLGETGIRFQTSGASNPPSRMRSPYLAAAICWLLFVEIATSGWYRLHERNLVSSPEWSVQWPKRAANFRKLKIDEEIRAVLRFDEARAAGWTTDSPINGPDSPSCLVYVFRWRPGKNSALLANLHRPDVCLPASGWTQVADHGARSYRVNDSFGLPFRHFEFRRRFQDSPPQTAHAFYCLSEDRASGALAPPPGTNSPGMFGNRSEWTRTERFSAVLEGRRHLGQHVMEVIFASANPLSTSDAEALLRDLVAHIVVLQEPRKPIQ